MITGLMVVDKDNHIVFEPNQFMVHPILGHISLLEELSEKGVVLYGQTSFEAVYKNIPAHHPTATSYVGADLDDVIANHRFAPIIIVGNKTILKNIDKIDILMIIKYRSGGLNPGEETFAFPSLQPQSIAKLINYEILTYRLPK